MTDLPSPCPFCGVRPHQGLTKATRDMHGDVNQSYRFYCPAGCAQKTAANKDRALLGWNTRTDIAQARIAAVELERDCWKEMVGKIAATIPVKDTIGATGTLGDMIEYLKSNQARIAELEAELKGWQDQFKAQFPDAIAALKAKP
jgi:hypothetical protein